MRRLIALLTVVGALAGGATMGIMGAAAIEEEGGATLAEEPAISDSTAPSEPEDRGAGEHLILVVGGSFATRAEAQAANAGLTFGDVQGYYVAATDQFQGLRASLGAAAGDYVLVSAFRTEAGALEFADLATSAGLPALITDRLYNRGDEYVGLGQEPAPDGSGPLRGPIPGVTLK
jgi:hypothetical protein